MNFLGWSTMKKRRDGPFADSFELLGVINRDVNSKVHSSLHKVHVETSDLGIGDFGFHS